MKPKKHDHRQSMWIVGYHVLWCYQCGAWRFQHDRGARWNKPTGIGGPNPAMKEKKR